MVLQNTFALAILLVGASVSSAGIVERAEHLELLASDGESMPRVVRDRDGHVTTLNLRGMTLSQDDFKEVSNLPRLRALVLMETNVADDDLSHLKHCRHLDHLNLTSTEVTDHAIDTILELNSLKSICLGDVRISPEAIARLKDRNRGLPHRDQMRLGYSQRRD